jgi:hypothetical protein
VPQQRAVQQQRPVLTTRGPPSPPTQQIPRPTPTQQTKFRSSPPPIQSPTYSPEKTLYNNANHLIPGQLYTNTNGAYQAYYSSGGVNGDEPSMAGLEEIEPQVINFNVPIHKMIPVLEQHFPNRNQGSIIIHIDKYPQGKTNEFACMI